MSLSSKEDLSILKGFDIYKGVNESIIVDSIQGAVSKTLKHREILYRAGDPVSSFGILLSGAIKLIRPTMRGDDVIVHIAISGDLIGALLMTQGPKSIFPVTAKSMGPSKILCIPRETFQNVWAKDVILQNNLNSILYRRMSNIQDDKIHFADPLKTRIAHLLLRHLNQSENEGSNVLSIPMTRQEMADSLGVAVESVIRIMSEWSQLGIIRSTDKILEILELEELLKNTEQ